MSEVQRLYLRLNNSTCTLDENTGYWKIRLPEQFTNSRSKNKQINVLSFMYIVALDPPTAGVSFNIDFTTFHSPTLCDGNFNQDNYITTLCYTQSSVDKQYPIKSNPQDFEFYFKDNNDEIIKIFWYAGNESNISYVYGEKFCIDLELIF